ncbi:MAG: hypothetical protein ACHQM6_07495, partial [Candidatus Kapaibacterium sp.]
MKRYFVYLMVLILFPSFACAQLVSKKLIVPLQFQKIIDSNTMVMIPEEYEINVFYADPAKLIRPRFMALSPK